MSFYSFFLSVFPLTQQQANQLNTNMSQQVPNQPNMMGGKCCIKHFYLSSAEI